MKAIKIFLILLVMCLALVILEGAAHTQSATISNGSTSTEQNPVHTYDASMEALVNAMVTGYSIPAVMVAGESYPVSVTMQNTGTLPWNESSMFRLGMVGDDTGDAYKFNGVTTRVWLPDGANVLPGESVTFTFTMTAPSAGTYYPSYQMVWEGHEWFGDVLSTTVDVSRAQVDATIISDTIPGSMIAGQPYPVSVTMQNTGTLPWNESSMFRLGMVGDDTGDAYKFNGVTARIWLPDGANVLPGESVTFTFTMTAPTTPDTYYPSYQMVWEGHEWFGDTLTKTITVYTPAWSFTINNDPSKVVDDTLYNKLINCMAYPNGTKDIPPGGSIRLEYFLYYYGVYPVTEVSYNNTTYDWYEMVHEYDDDDTPSVTPNGSIYHAGTWTQVTNVDVTTTPGTDVTTLDLMPSIRYALDADWSTPGLLPNKTSQVVLIYIDAFGYQRYQDSNVSIISNISELGPPIKATCVYPSFAAPNAKALLTGVGPDLVRGDFNSTVPVNETIFDILNNLSMTAAWVDYPQSGFGVPVQVDNTIISYDEVGATLQQYEAGTNLTVVHFNNPDRPMIQFGPNTPQAEESIRQADEAVGYIVSHLNEGTVVIIWGDHGCHSTDSGGNYRTLLPDDMYIPITVYYMPQPNVTPVASFTSNVTSGTVPFTVQFNDTSSYSPYAWNWDFGDGNTSTLRNPVHTYTMAGTYNVSLTATNVVGNDTTTRAGYITASNPQPVVANFTSNVTSGLANLTVNFTDTSTGDPKFWNWSFGDGTPNSSEQNPVHVYNNPDNNTHTYNVSLWASNERFNDTLTQVYYITVGSEYSANFTANVTSGLAWNLSTSGVGPNFGAEPLVVQFYDTSVGATAWNWSFGDNTTNSTLRNPVHSFANAWSYNVTLTVTVNTSTNDTYTEEKTDYINVLLPIVGDVYHPTELSLSDLENESKFSQVNITNHTYGAHGSFYKMWATGASFNEILDSVGTGAILITFYGSDGYTATIPISHIRNDPDSMIAYDWWNNDTTGLSGNNQTMRNIEPGDTYAQYWVFGLVGIKVWLVP